MIDLYTNNTIFIPSKQAINMNYAFAIMKISSFFILKIRKLKLLRFFGALLFPVFPWPPLFVVH